MMMNVNTMIQRTLSTSDEDNRGHRGGGGGGVGSEGVALPRSIEHALLGECSSKLKGYGADPFFGRRRPGALEDTTTR